MSLPNQPGAGRAWAVTFAGTGINLCLGVLYTWSVFAAALINQLGWSKTASAIPYTIACVVFAIAMVPAGRLVDKIGPRWVATIGGIFAGGGLILSGLFGNSFQVLAITFGVIVGIGLGFGYAAPTPAAVKWFKPHMKGQISGLVVAGFGLASVYIAPMTNAFIKSFGVIHSFYVEGLIFLIATVILAQVLSFPPSGYQPVGGQPPATRAAAAAASKRDFSPTEMLATPQFYLLWLMYAFTASAGLMIIGHLAKIAEIQAGIKWGFAFVAVLAVANAGGRILAGWLSDKLGRTNTMLLVFLIQAANMFMFASYRSVGALLVGAILTGIAYGSLLSLFPSATYDFFGLKHAGVNYGWVFTAWGAGSLIGPIIAGRMADLYKVYNNAYLISAVLLLVAAVMALVTRPPKVPVADTSVKA
ncbi:MFS transporter [Desulfofundulus thermobenzoicus]|uniref:MFS transporter n=1 Tax=Desulfofundulus thermobenzoicus TaxID=29376 RepID=A0A6N7IPV3_9FIRM|nr:OFA family MFS transporter [Desulfofundulus thermobenzoicus]MQL52010.1 MFS transporter [Desulfofundulus thermobenzoicus]HHW43387.1 OFA family MFS transporter [Desulfotomaculum sp.]